MDAQTSVPLAPHKPIETLSTTLGNALTRKIHESRVLLVGAGGIGCEVLKNLVCSGFGSPYTGTVAQNGATQVHSSRKAEIVVVDLDTIDLSNLNRQFLFRKQHIKQPKATVAKETASKFNPSVSIDARHGSIFDPEFNVTFFEGFDVVFNALDNLAARRHVNKMCLAADVPLIESGTTGFNGQVQAIQKGVTECYDCNPKPVQKSFPICTIRSTPSQPIHCIVWAKSYLFPELFGTSEEDSTDMSVTAGDNAEEVAKLREEAQALKKIRSMMGKEGFAQAVFDKVYYDDIERLRSMTEMWQSRTAPESLRFVELGAGSDLVKAGQALVTQDQNTWTPQENLAVFCYSLDTLSSRMGAGENVIEFDKDDKDTLDFVTSAANLRSLIFKIPLHSEWSVKQMAGNIIPAIATSNALTASLCVLQSFKIMRSQMAAANTNANGSANSNGTSNGALAQPSTNNNLPIAKATPAPLMGGAKMVFLTSKHTERLISASALNAPNPICPVCSPIYAKLRLPNPKTINTPIAPNPPTLQQLVDLLRDRFGYEDFSISTNAGIVYEPDLEDNVGRPLQEMGVVGDAPSFLTVSDEGDEAKVDLVVSYSFAEAGEEGGVTDEDGAPALALLPAGLKSLPLKPAKKALAADAVLNGADGEGVAAALANGGSKRKREAEADEAEGLESAKKRAKAMEQEVLTIEDDGAIMLDD